MGKIVTNNAIHTPKQPVKPSFRLEGIWISLADSAMSMNPGKEGRISHEISDHDPAKNRTSCQWNGEENEAELETNGTNARPVSTGPKPHCSYTSL